MGWAYGIDLRKRVVDVIEAGLSHRQAAERFCVAVSNAGNWHRLWRATGSTRPGKQGQPSHSKLDVYEAHILAMVEEDKDIALYEIADRMMQDHGARVAPSTVWHFFKKRGTTFKKDGARERTAARRCEGRPASLV